MNYDEVYLHIGGFGRFQKRILVLACILIVPTGYIAFSPVFLIASTEHWCKIPELEKINCSTWNVSSDECYDVKRAIAIPVSDDSNGLQNCLRYNISKFDLNATSSNSENQDIACDSGWEYDYSVYKKTVKQEFDLVCDDEDIAPWTSVAFYTGVLTGSFIFGIFADYFGRKRVMFLALGWTIIMETAASLSPNVIWFAVFRFLSGNSTTAIYIITFVYCSEVVKASKRTLMGLALPIAWAVGYIVLAILAYLFRDWRDLILVKTLPMLLLFIAYPFIPESPRWLLSKNRASEAKAVLSTIANENGEVLPDYVFEKLLEIYNTTQKERKTYSVIDLFRTSVIRRRMIVLFVTWLTNDLVYYGLSLSTASLGINEFVAALMSAAVEIPAYLVFLPVVKLKGRKLPMVLILAISGISCIIAIWTPIGWWKTAFIMVAKFLVTASFAIVYIFTSELLPTPVRSVGIGACSSFARLGSILAPQILYISKIWDYLPQVLFGSMSLLSAAMLLLLPETNNRPMPQTLGEAENIGRTEEQSERKNGFSPIQIKEETL